MQKDETYIVKTSTGVCTMKILAVTSAAVKVRFGNGCTEWIYKTDFKSKDSFVDPKKKILEQLN